MKKFLLYGGLAACLLGALRAEPENRLAIDVPSTPEHPRNSEGAFATLKSGRIVFYFSQFYSGASDFSHARIAEIHSDDRGRTWSQPQVFMDNGKAMNLMSLSMLRLASGKLALVYGIKQSTLDCHPYIRLSSDEGVTWSEAKPIVATPGYIVFNNDRLIQTHTGRLIAPVADHRLKSMIDDGFKTFNPCGFLLWYYSDDEGATWKEADTPWSLPVADANGLQEPGAVELADGSLYSWARTDLGQQYAFHSRDNGKTWSPPEPTTLKSPLSPAGIKRLPHSSALLAIYNDHSGRFPHPPVTNPYRSRSPLVAAISTDNGQTWPTAKLLEGDLTANFAYTAIHFVDDAVLLGYSTSTANGNHLGTLRIRRIDLSWLTAPTP